MDTLDQVHLLNWRNNSEDEEDLSSEVQILVLDEAAPHLQKSAPRDNEIKEDVIEKQLTSEDVVHSKDSFQLNGTHTKHFGLDGFLFGKDGVTSSFSTLITTSLVHDFRNIEIEAKKRILDPFNETSYCVLSPAIEKLESGYLAAFRIYRCDHRKKPKREQLQKDFVFIQKYTSHLQLDGDGHLVGVGTTRIPTNHLCDGPQDPRAFIVNGSIFFTFHATVYLSKDGSQSIQQPILWDPSHNIPRVLNLTNNLMHSNKDEFLYDKNWMALSNNSTMLFIQTLDPLLVVQCNPDAHCNYIHESEGKKYPFEWNTSLRGGSQFQLYQWPYYIGAVHSLYRYNWNNYIYRQYGAHLVVLNAINYRLVFTSGLLKIDKSLYAQTVKPMTFMTDFFFPTSLLVETKDSLLIGGHMNDDISILIRVQGIVRLMHDVISRDLQENPQQLGPKDGTVQAFFKSHFTQYFTNQKTKT